MMDWCPIETAPKDGKPVAAHHDSWDCPQCVQWETGEEFGHPEAGPFWCYVETILQEVDPEANPTHWHPEMTQVMRETAATGALPKTTEQKEPA